MIIKSLSFAAALALLPAAAFAQDREAPDAAEICGAEASDFAADIDVDTDDETPDSPTIQRLEEAARAFGEKMEAFGERAEGVCEDTALNDDQKEQRIAALWQEYQPDLMAFTSLAATLGPQIAAEALSEIDVAALVEEAMVEVNESGAMQGAMGIARNSAWTSGDPEHMATLGLVAEYAAGEAMDAVEEAQAEEATTAPAPAKPAKAD